MSNVRNIDGKLKSVSNDAKSILNEIDTTAKVKQMGRQTCTKRAPANDAILPWGDGAGGAGSKSWFAQTKSISN